MKRLTLCALLFVLAGCGSGGGTVPETPPDTSNVGTWSGTWQFMDTTVSPERELSRGTATVEITVPVRSERYACELTDVVGAVSTISIARDLKQWTIHPAGQSAYTMEERPDVSPGGGVYTEAGGKKTLRLTVPANYGPTREYRIVGYRVTGG